MDMTSEGSGSCAAMPSAGHAAGAAAAAAVTSSRPHHPHAFKLRFGAPREPGRSYVSAIKPLNLPAIVTDKWYSRSGGGGGREAALSAAEEAALRRVRDKFECGPRDRLAAPQLESHVVGWWADAATPERDWRLARLRYAIRDSAWLKQRARLLSQPHQQTTR